MKERIGGEISVSYADVAEIACQTGSQQFIKYSKLARLINYTQTCTVRAKTISNRILVNVFICITQFGFCCIYTVFMGANMKQVTRASKSRFYSISFFPNIIGCRLLRARITVGRPHIYVPRHNSSDFPQLDTRSKTFGPYLAHR